MMLGGVALPTKYFSLRCWPLVTQQSSNVIHPGVTDPHTHRLPAVSFGCALSDEEMECEECDALTL